MIKKKSWLWWFTIFANSNVTTTISPHIYVCKNFSTLPKSIQERIIKHEKIHLQQQKEQGLVKFLFLYIFALPLFYNPRRYKWEYEAYTKSGTSEKQAKEYLSSWHYGFLLNTNKKEAPGGI
ncbi:MAG: hypothetical protein Q8R18_02870 [bacterium]|nr:hypothetical protein [bacterium]